MSTVAPGGDIKYHFHYLEGKKFNTLESNETIDFIEKWSMKNRLLCQCYCFDEAFKLYELKEFCKHFFTDPAVTSTLKVASGRSEPSLLYDKVYSVEASEIPCTLTSTTLFNKLYGPIVRENGNIKKCLDDFLDDMLISDELRRMLLLEDSENYELFSEKERGEFLFRLFQHLCLGGAVCQFEDNVQPYLDTAKGLYKDLVTVQKVENNIQVVSHVFSVIAKNERGDSIYPQSGPIHLNSFAYLVVDPYKRHVNVLSHVFG